MFRNRQSSQKPSDELFERFRQSFPSVSSTAGEQTNGLNALQDSTLNRGGFSHEDLDPTPRAPSEPFRFTPSLLDPSSAAFAAFANQPPGYYTPTPGGQNTSFPGTTHHDLQTPNLGISAGTPLSVPHINTLLPAPNGDLSNYQNQAIHPQQFQNYHPFMSQPLQQHFSVHNFDSPASPKGSPMQVTNGDDDMMDHSLLFSSTGLQFDEDLSLSSVQEKFRFHVTLNAPTAMIKHRDEIPVTYLNKGQAYSISVVDTAPPSPSPGIVRYRTFVRISFQDEGQRQKPATCWQLWKEGRGLNEAHQRGGKLQAVEYVEMVVAGEEEKKKGRMTIESSSFDGFSVVWTPGINSSAEASISVRFNFLSTDFSHSKGVKGIPVRLCAKTEILSTGSPRSPDEQPEVCYCKVKLFRDHGAERKLANDILHVKKTIEKLRQQSNLVDDPTPQHGKKRKDSLSQAKLVVGGESRSGKVPKHKRTWSVSSASSAGAVNRGVLEEDLSAKLSSMQDMFTSTRPVSILYLRGADLDDPDLHPIYLPSESQDANEGVWSRRPSNVSIATSNPASSFVSPTPSSASLSSQHGERFANPEQREWATYQTLNQTTNSTNDNPVRVKAASDTGMLSGWIEAIGIDHSYVPPTERPIKPVMCVYILPLVDGLATEPPYYRAVYLAERTQFCLTSSIALKCGLDPSTIVRTSRQNPLGLEIVVDDDVVKEMSEGQDIKVQLREVIGQMLSPPQTDWAHDPLLDGDMKPELSKGWELCLFY